MCAGPGAGVAPPLLEWQGEDGDGRVRVRVRVRVGWARMGMAGPRQVCTVSKLAL